MSSAALAQPSTTTNPPAQKQNSQQSFTKKPAPLDLKVASQDSTQSFSYPSSSNGQKTPPTVALAFATLTLDSGIKEKKIGHRRVDEQTGQVTYKKKATSDLNKSIQLGIGQSVGSLTSKPTRDVLMQDFSVVETVHFPENGSNLTPAHKAGEFKFKTYAPIAFRYFREIFGIQTDDFLISLTSLPLTELSNPGASGSVFFITEDDEFIIKTVQHKEADFLQKLLPGYYMNLNQNPRTLLPKFYGLYCLQTGGKNIRLCVMNNLLPKAIRMCEKYDLKGSTYKRKASKHELAKSSPTFKDLDFKERNPDGILLESDTYDALMKTIKRDCRVLESFKIMDYSLLLCIYNVDEHKKKRLNQQQHSEGPASAGIAPPTGTFLLSVSEQQPSTSSAVGGAGAVGGAAAPGAEGMATPGPINRGRSTKHRLQNFSTAMESIQADVAEPVELEDEDVPPGGIPARNVKGERLLLYAGVIDILQSYRLKKKLEHGFKSIVYDGDSISVHRPSFYAQRFQTFFEKEVFKKIVSPVRSPSKKKASRQRSVTETTNPPTTTEDTTVSVETEGSLLHKNKPDIIPQQSPIPVDDDEVRPSTSTGTVGSKWSGGSVTSSVVYSSSSTSTTMYSYQGAHSKDGLASVQELQDSNTSSSYAGPPLDEGPPPPYSETIPADSKALSSPTAEDTNTVSGGATARHNTDDSQGSETEGAGIAATPGAASASRREPRKGVRFSVSEDDLDDNSQLFRETHRGVGLVAAGTPDIQITTCDSDSQVVASSTEDDCSLGQPFPVATDISLSSKDCGGDEQEDILSPEQISVQLDSENSTSNQPISNDEAVKEPIGDQVA